MNVSRPNLPRLLYLGDVPVEASYHGSALVYRLLQEYPAGKIGVVEANVLGSLPHRRLNGVHYSALRVGQSRWLSTRFHSFVSSWFTLKAPFLTSRIPPLLADFLPEAVLTVAHGYSWLTAAAFAQEWGLPLHLIVHDDWPRIAQLPQFMRRWLDRRFCQVYRQAASRLCVSPFMVEEYERRYGVRGTLLYPSRAVDAPKFTLPPERLSGTVRPLVFAFGGSVNTVGHVRTLCQLADVLQPIGAQLHLYGPINETDIKRMGLLRANVQLRGLLPAQEFISRMRSEVDVLFLPMSFAPEDRANMSLCFPSKLTDYTAAGLSIFIYGPEYSSAVRWARENPGIAMIATTEDSAHLAETVRQIAGDAANRNALGARALEVGESYFSGEAARNILYAALSGSDKPVLPVGVGL